VVAFAGAIAVYAHQDAAPACDSKLAMSGVYDVLRDEFHLDGLFVNNVVPEAGWFFSRSRDCAAQITQIKGSVDVATLQWRAIHYRIVHRDTSERPAITLDLGGPAPLETPDQSLWARVRARL
jgi:hypothetical protein